MSDVAAHLVSENARLHCALKRLIVAASELAKVADYPQPGQYGDDFRHDVWRAALDGALKTSREAVGEPLA